MSCVVGLLAAAMVVLILAGLVLSLWNDLLEKRTELREKEFAREVRLALVAKLGERLIGMPEPRAENVLKEFESLVLNGKLRRSKADV